MAEARFVTAGTTGHEPVTASDHGYGPDNTRPGWVDQLPDPNAEDARFTGSACVRPPLGGASWPASPRSAA